MAQFSDDLKKQGERLVYEAAAQFRRGQFDAAILSWQELITLYQHLEDPLAERSMLQNLANTYL